jgi:hypothetical protein
MNTAPITTASDTFYTWGQADENAIYLNVDAATRTAAGNGSKFVDTLAHEVNHFRERAHGGRHGRPFPGRVPRFVGGQGGRARAPAHRRRATRLVDEPRRRHEPGVLSLGEPPRHGPKFAAGVKAITDKLNGSPPTTVSPEEARALLLGAGNNSDYLNKAGNLDNH